MWTLRRYNNMSSNLWKDNVVVGSDSGLMVQSFNRKGIVIYVKLRNYDLGDQSRSALEHLFTKYWRNSNAVQQIWPRKRISSQLSDDALVFDRNWFLWQHTQNGLVFRYGCEKNTIWVFNRVEEYLEVQPPRESLGSMVFHAFWNIDF